MTFAKKILPIATIAVLAFPGAALAKGPKAKMQFSASAYAVAENGGNAVITITRSGKTGTPRLNQAASVNFTTSDGTAKAGVDYTATSTTVQFAANQPSATVSVPIINKDSINTGPRTINLKLSQPTGTNGGVLGYPSAATLVISDDDSSNGSGGTTAPTFQLAADTDYVSEPASGTTGTETVYIIRSGDLSTSATVNYSTADGTALAGQDYTTTTSQVTFPSSATAVNSADAIIQAIQIPLLYDGSATEPMRSFTFSLALPSGSNSLLTAPTSETVNIVNIDGSPTVQWSSPSYSVNENGGSVRLTAFVAGNVTSEVDAPYATKDGSAVAGVNYTSASDTFQFLPGDGDVAESVDVPVLDDGVTGDKYFTVDLTRPDSSVDTATVSILNTDAAPADNGTATTGGTTGSTPTTGGQDGGQQLLLGARQAACGLVVKAAKSQRLLKTKSLKLVLRSAQPCKVSVAAKINQLRASKKRSAKGARSLTFRGKTTALTLQSGKAKTVKVKFTKKTLAAIKKALRARNKKLVATVIVTTRDSASKVNHKTLKITIKR